MEQLVLVTDIGTQSLRVSIVNREGVIEDTEKIKYSNPFVKLDRNAAEVDPFFYIHAFCEAASKLISRIGNRKKDIMALSVSTIRDTFVCLERLSDGRYRPVGNIIHWLDKREADERVFRFSLFNRILMKLGGVGYKIKCVGRQSKSNLVRDIYPKNWERTDKFVQLPSFINYLLTGNLVDTRPNEVGHIPLNYRNGKWYGRHHIKRQIFQISDSQLVDLVPTGSVIGKLRQQICGKIGLEDSIDVYQPGSDQACVQIGLGAVTSDKASVSLGTAATLQIITDHYFEPESLLPPYFSVVPGKWTGEFQLYSGYNLVSWFKNNFMLDSERKLAKDTGVSEESVLDRLLDDTEKGADGLYVIPLWTPSAKLPDAKGAFIGFDGKHTRAHMYRAILEGINYELMDAFYRIQRRGRMKVDEIYVSGGGSMSDRVCQLMADMFGLPVVRMKEIEATTIGAALAVFVQRGFFADFGEACSAMVHRQKVFKPNEEHSRFYNEFYHNIYRGSLNLVMGRFRSINKFFKKRMANK